MLDIQKKIGIRVPEVLMPREGIALEKWAVVACDQFSSQPEYWEEVEKMCEDQESTLHIIFPEAYLGKVKDEDMIAKINRTMEKYLDEKILVDQGPGFIYIDRETPYVKSRRGLIISLDLECYKYEMGSKSLARSTEETDIHRLPPRVKIREKAPVELPHILLLIDDPKETVIEPLEEETGYYKPIYDFDLMMSGGHIKGFKIEEEKTILRIMEALENLISPGEQKDKYKLEEAPFLFAVGDGNHSLASAKDHWENVKKGLSEDERENHPARFALVELMNLHDKGLEFEPIHRVIFNTAFDNFVKEFKEFYPESSYLSCKTKEEMLEKAKDLRKEGLYHILPFVNKEGYGLFLVKNPKFNLEVGTLQIFLDKYLKENKQIHIDYIHGEAVLEELGSKENNLAFYLPSMDKKDLFKTVILDGVLPKKTFSMGEAEEKRYYLESKKTT